MDATEARRKGINDCLRELGDALVRELPSSFVRLRDLDHVALEPLSGGAAISLASATPNSLVSGIAVDDTSVYWTSADSVLKVAINGGAPETLASGQAEPGPIAVDANGVYWGNLGVPGSGHGSIVMLTPK
jgi:hypothetical protein